MSPGPKPGIAIHRTYELPADEVTRRDRLPVTSPGRAILEVAPTLRDRQLEQMLAEAHRRGEALDLPSLIDRYPRRPGTPALRRLLGIGPKFTRSKRERRYLEAFRRAGLPEPDTNAAVAGFEVDFVWEEHRLVLEVDGDPFHSARPDRVRDYRRDARLGELGFRVLRVDADEPVDRAVALIARATR
jgi:very-short-patch-repair endonuclease